MPETALFYPDGTLADHPMHWLDYVLRATTI